MSTPGRSNHPCLEFVTCEKYSFLLSLKIILKGETKQKYSRTKCTSVRKEDIILLIVDKNRVETVFVFYSTPLEIVLWYSVGAQ